MRRFAIASATHVSQKGSLVAPTTSASTSRIPRPDPRGNRAVEAEVNAEIRANEPVTTR
jgi:hypothetical protein